MHTAVCKISFHGECFVALHLTLMSYKAFFLFQGRTKAISILIMRLSTIWFSFSKIHLCDQEKDTKRSNVLMYSIVGALPSLLKGAYFVLLLDTWIICSCPESPIISSTGCRQTGFTVVISGLSVFTHLPSIEKELYSFKSTTVEYYYVGNSRQKINITCWIGRLYLTLVGYDLPTTQLDTYGRMFGNQTSSLLKCCCRKTNQLHFYISLSCLMFWCM